MKKNQTPFLSAFALLAVGLLGGCPQPGAAVVDDRTCFASVYDNTARVGFDPPAGFVQSSGCSGPCDLSVSNGFITITMFTFPHDAAGLGSAVEKWNRRGPTGEPGFLLDKSVDISLTNGQDAIFSDWYDPFAGDYFMELWVRSSSKDVQLSAYYTVLDLPARDSLIASLRSACFD